MAKLVKFWWYFIKWRTYSLSKQKMR